MIKVAAVQMEIKPLDISANLEKANKMLKKIFFNNNCDLVVFPEDFITGPIENNLDFTQDENSDSITILRNLAIKYKTYLVAGSFIKMVNEKYFNTSILIDRSGRIILEYQKNNLWILERKYLTPGNEVNLAKTPIGNIGIIICWDLAFPEICQKLAKMHADIICCPSYWTAKDEERLSKRYKITAGHNFVNNLVPARAMENEVLFIYANGGGEARIKRKTKDWIAPQIGLSQISIPVFGTVMKIDNNREGFILYEYDKKIAKDAEMLYHIKEDLRKNYDL